jgi:hypothetical protein
MNEADIPSHPENEGKNAANDTDPPPPGWWDTFEK